LLRGTGLISWGSRTRQNRFDHTALILLQVLILLQLQDTIMLLEDERPVKKARTEGPDTVVTTLAVPHLGDVMWLAVALD
jgi:hypothetical protein